MEWIRRAARAAAHALRWLFFTAVWLGVLLAGLELLVKQLLAPKPEAGAITAAGVLVLIAALFARHGEDIAKRIKKIGPIELFEEVQEALGTLDEIGARVPETVISDDERTLDLRPVELSVEERFSFQQGELYAATLMALGKEPTRTEIRQKYFGLLFKVGACAFGQTEWPRAVARLGRLDDLSGGAFQAHEVRFYLGVAHCYWAIATEKPAERQRLFGKARDLLYGLARRSDPRFRTYFFLAYAEDELGFWYEAVRHNREALKRRPRFAPAKYNLAVSYLKLDAGREALRALESIRATDREVDKTRIWKTDPDLLPRMTDERLRRSAMRVMEEIQRQVQLRRAR